MPKFDTSKPSKEADNRWVKAYKFASENRVVDITGKEVDPTFQGRKYRLISKEVRSFTASERVLRIFLATLTVVFSLGLALSFKTIRKLYTKKTEARRIGVHLLPDQKPPLDVSPPKVNPKTPSPENAALKTPSYSKEKITAAEEIVALLNKWREAPISDKLEAKISWQRGVGIFCSDFDSLNTGLWGLIGSIDMLERKIYKRWEDISDETEKLEISWETINIEEQVEVIRKLYFNKLSELFPCLSDVHIDKHLFNGLQSIYGENAVSVKNISKSMEELSLALPKKAEEFWAAFSSKIDTLKEGPLKKVSQKAIDTSKLEFIKCHKEWVIKADLFQKMGHDLERIFELIKIIVQ